MKSYTTRQARENFSEVVNLAAFSKDPVELTRRGKPIAFLVHPDYIEAMEAYEDAIDVAECERILADIESGKEKLIPWEQVKQELGL